MFAGRGRVQTPTVTDAGVGPVGRRLRVAAVALALTVPVGAMTLPGVADARALVRGDFTITVELPTASLDGRDLHRVRLSLIVRVATRLGTQHTGRVTP